MVQDTVDEETVLSLANRYGELDGEIVYNYVTNSTLVDSTLSYAQGIQMMSMREEWNDIPCTGVYLYSEKINMPTIINTDFLFLAVVLAAQVLETGPLLK